MSQETKGKKTNSKSSKVGWFLLIVIIIFAVGFSAYWWRDNQAKQQAATDQKTIAALQAKVTEYEKQAQESATKATSDEPISKQPTTTAIDNIKDAIISGNTAALESYMANPVKVVYAASEAAGDRTPAQAVNDLKYLSAATGPWNFSIETATLDKWAKGAYSQYFLATSLVGKSSNGYVIVFNFNKDAKMSGIFMSASSDLL